MDDQPTSQAIVERVLRAWCDVLEIDEVDVQSNFFDMGGDSFLAVEFSVLIEEVTGIELPLATLFEAQSLQDILQFLLRIWAAGVSES